MKKLTEQGRLINISDVTNTEVEEVNIPRDNTGYSFFSDTGEFLIHSEVNNININLGEFDNFQQSDGTVSADIAAAKTYLNELFTDD